MLIRSPQVIAQHYPEREDWVFVKTPINLVIISASLAFHTDRV